MTGVANIVEDRPALVLFDVCDTLYAANTTLGFLDFLLGRRPGFRLKRWLLTSRMSPVFYAAAAAYRIGRIDVARGTLLRSLGGMNRQQLAEAARRYVREELGKRRNQPVMALLEKHRPRDRVVLVSASLDPVVEAIAAELGVEYRSSRLAYDGGRCLGRLAEDLTRRKHLVAAELRGEPDTPVHVYTDNASDALLLAMADKATVIVPPGRSAGWAREYECDLLRL